MSKKIRFIGADWQNKNSNYCKKIITEKLFSDNPESLVVGSVISFLEKDFRRHYKIENAQNCFLILDLYNIFIYKDNITINNAQTEDIMQYISDITAKSHFDLLKVYGKTRPILPILFDEVIDFIPKLTKLLKPGWAYSINTKSFEISSFKTSQHPLIARKNDKVSPNKTYENKIYELKSLYVNGTGRSSDLPQIQLSSSQSAGLIRSTDTVMNDLSFPGNRTMVAWREGSDRLVCGGTHNKAKSAEIISVCEALERFQVMYHPTDEKLLFAAYNDIENIAVNPQSLFYNTNSRQFDPSKEIYWSEAYDLSKNKKTLIPAQEIWFDNERLPGENIWIANTTNGCAVGNTKEESILFAILEVVERDAFLTSWYLKRNCRQIIPETINNNQLQWLISRIRYLRPGYKLYFLDITNDLRIPTICSLAIRETGNGPKFLCAVASRLTCSQAALAALKDIQNLLAYTPDSAEFARFRKLRENPSLVLQPEDHKGLYMLDDSFDKVKFFIEGSSISLAEASQFDLIPNESADYDLKVLIEAITEFCKKAGISMIVKEITQNNLKSHQMHCVKAIGTDMFPIWYGLENARVKVTPRLEKLSQLYNQKTLEKESDLNLEIHPFG